VYGRGRECGACARAGVSVLLAAVYGPGSALEFYSRTARA